MRTKRTEHTIEEYACAAYQDSPQKPYNTIQMQTGFDITNHMKGEVPYSSLRIVHVLFICDELVMRGVIFEADCSIKKLANALKNNDIEIQKQDIIEKTGCTNPKESDLNVKKFLPVHRTTDEYIIQ